MDACLRNAKATGETGRDASAKFLDYFLEERRNVAKGFVLTADLEQLTLQKISYQLCASDLSWFGADRYVVVLKAEKGATMPAKVGEESCVEGVSNLLSTGTYSFQLCAMQRARRD